MQIILILFLSLFLASSAFATEDGTIIPEVNSNAEQVEAQAQEDTQAQVTTITRAEIVNSPVLNIAELLQQEQSIVRLNNATVDNSQTALSIRGFGDNAVSNTLILVDGFPLVNPSLFAPNFNSIALTDVERIDIIEGSQGTLWGDQAVGGVVNIITRHPEKFLTDINAGLGSFNQQFYSGLIGTKFSNGVFFKGFLFSNETNNYRDHNRQTNDNGFLQVGWDYARGTLSLNVQIYEDTIQYPGGLTQAQYDADPQQATDFRSIAHYDTYVYHFLSKHEINDDWLLETRLSNRTINADGFVSASFTRDEWINSIHPRLIGNVYGSKVIVGYEFENSNYVLINQNHDTSYTQQQNMYGQVVMPFLTNFDVTLGGRFAWQDNATTEKVRGALDSTDRVFVTEQGIAFHPNKEWNFFVRRDGNFRFPKANELTWLPAEVDTLQMQTGVSYETGASWTTERQTAQINIFALQLHNELAFNPTQTEENPFGSFNNFDETSRRGVTLTEAYKLTSKATVDAQFNYVDARFTDGPFSGNNIPAVPAVTANAGLRYQFSPHWQVHYSALYTGARFASEDTMNQGKKLSGYWLNFAAIQYMLDAAKISFEVANLFNQKYAVYTLFDPVSQTNTYYPGAGRYYLLTFKVNVD